MLHCCFTGGFHTSDATEMLFSFDISQYFPSMSRVMFGKHKQGYIFPLMLALNMMEDGISGAVQRIDTSDEFIWFYSKSLTICGASQGSYRLLGVREPFLFNGWGFR